MYQALSVLCIRDTKRKKIKFPDLVEMILWQRCVRRHSVVYLRFPSPSQHILSLFLRVGSQLAIAPIPKRTVLSWGAPPQPGSHNVLSLVHSQWLTYRAQRPALCVPVPFMHQKFFPETRLPDTTPLPDCVSSCSPALFPPLKVFLDQHSFRMHLNPTLSLCF